MTKEYKDFQEWFADIVENGLICEEYKNKIFKRRSKLNIIQTVLDANGVSFLQEMNEKGFGLPYEVIMKQFKSYINGRYKAEFSKGDRIFYTSCLYCCYNESVQVDTTATVLLGCKCDVNIKDWDFVKLYVDTNCDITINCPENARCLVESWGNAKISVNSRKSDNVTINKNDE